MVRLVSCVMVFGLGLAAPGLAQDAKAGEKVYVDSKLTADDIRAWLTDANAMTGKTKAARKPAMKAYTLDKNQVDGLERYLSTVKKK